MKTASSPAQAPYALSFWHPKPLLYKRTFRLKRERKAKTKQGPEQRKDDVKNALSATWFWE